MRIFLENDALTVAVIDAKPSLRAVLLPGNLTEYGFGFQHKICIALNAYRPPEFSEPFRLFRRYEVGAYSVR